MYLLLILVVVSVVLIRGGRKTLKPLFHLLAVLTLLPSFLFACACLVLQDATAHNSLFGFFDAIFSFLVAMIPWGIAVLLVCFIILVAAGFRARWRRVAAGMVIALAFASAGVMHRVAGLPDDPSQWWFFAPGMLSVLISGWLFVAPQSLAREFALQYPGGLRIGRGLREEAMRSMQEQPGFAMRPMGAGGWVWYTLPAFRDGALPIGVELGFHHGALQQINVFHDDPAVYGTNREAGPENKEHLRAENTRAWLKVKGFPVGVYSWGEVWVDYNPRSDFGSAGIRYTPSLDRLPAADLPKYEQVKSPVNARLNLKTLCAFVAGAAVFASSLHAQTPAPKPSSSFEQSLCEVRSTLRIEKEGFGGSGAPVLAKAIADARYVLIGEDHFTREIPQFTSAVCDLMVPQGLFALATEASPNAAEFVGATLDKPDRTERLAALLKKYPDCMVFLNSRQENDLAAHVARTVHGSGFQLWGLDQEFVGSAGWLLDQILAQHPGPSATAALTRLRVEEQKEATDAKSSGDPSKLFLLSAADAELAETTALLQREGNDRANALFHALTESREIYLKNAQSSPDSNRQRARLLKSNFRQRLDAAGANGRIGKVLVKLGDWHIYKGFNPLHERDLGNYVAELADEQGSASLHICILGAKGRHALYAGYATPPKIEPFVMAEDPDYHWIKTAVDNQLPDGWTLFDLRRLRSKEIGKTDPAMSRLIEGCELLIIIPEITPADPIQ